MVRIAGILGSIAVLTAIMYCSACAEDHDPQALLQRTWLHYKSHKLATSGRPLADRDTRGISQGSKGSYLTFSETVSYVLFRAVWMNDREAFDKTWEWSYRNLMRRNIHVYEVNKKQWTELPGAKKDNLFAWRWTENADGAGRGGVLYAPWSEKTKENVWRSGHQVAPDGDELIAGALIFAHLRWGSQPGQLHYLDNARGVLRDLWDKCVVYLVPGSIGDFENGASFHSWFSYASDRVDVSLQPVHGVEGRQGLCADAYGSPYVGVGKPLGDSDLSNVGGISFYTRDTFAIKVLLEDRHGLKAQAVRNVWGSDWEKVVVPFYEMETPKGFDWEHVTAVMFQTEEDRCYIDDVRLYGGDIVGKPSYHLVANDDGQPWINVSYYMPFLYELFALVDPQRPWTKLIDAAYYDIERGSSARLHDGKGQRYNGNRALVPDWFMYTYTGAVTDLPWAEDNSIDDYLCSWDAFRTWYFIALHGSWFEAPLSENILKHKTYEFFKKELKSKGFIAGGYYISGETGPVRGIQYEYPGMNGSYLALFTAAGDRAASSQLFDRIMKRYNSQGYWGDDPHEYYNQNWAWFGLAFYHDKGAPLVQLMDKAVSLWGDSPAKLAFSGK